MAATSLSVALASGDASDLLAALATIRVKIDSMPQIDYIAFLENHFMSLRDLLLANPIQYEDNEINKLRHAVLEIFSRLPQQGVMKEYVADLMSVGIKTLSEDNESNALLALKIVSDMNRSFRTQLEHNVQALMECVYKIYDNMPAVIDSSSGHNMSMTSSSTSSSMSIMNKNTDVKLVTMSSSASSASSSSSFSSSSSKHSVRLYKALESFRVLTECPVLVLLLFQLYPRCIPKSIPLLVPVMVNMLRLSPQPPEDKYDKVAVTAYRDFFVSQVKTLSLITHLVRTHSEPMRVHESNVVISIMSMFRRCPDDSMSSRKDVLASTRYIVNSEYRNSFLPCLDEILEANIFFGPHENLKSSAYVVTAELVTNIKDSLSQPQLFGIVLLFCNIISDSKIVLGTHLVSVRLIFNFADKISKLCADDGVTVLPEAYSLIVSILKCIVRKYQSFRIEIEKKWAIDVPVSALQAKPERTSPVSRTEMHEKDAMRIYERDAKHLMKTLIWGMRTLFANLQNMKNPDPNVLPFLTSAALHSQYFRGALECCLIFMTGKESPSIDGTEKPMIDNNAEMKDVMEHFVISLRELPPEILREALSRNLDFLSDLALKDSMFLYVVNSLLVHTRTVAVAVDVTLSFFISKLPDLRHVTIALKPGGVGAESEAYEMGQRSAILLRLFKFSLAAIANTKDKAAYLRSRLSKLVIESLRLANNSRDPVNYYYLLKNVFKTISLSKLDKCFEEMQQWMHHLVLGVESLLRRTANKNMQCFILELSILLPARFQSLPPILPNLLRFVVKALKMKGELPQLALRTLEFWIEKLNPAFVSNIVENAGLFEELLDGVASHLLPFPYLYGTLALRVIGKLGGHTQKLVKHPPLYFITSPTQLSSARTCLDLRIKDSSIMDTDTAGDTFHLQLDGSVFGACEILCSTADWASTSDGEGMLFLSETLSPGKTAPTILDFSTLLPDKAMSDCVVGSAPVGERGEAKRFVKETKTVRDMLFAEQKKTALRLIIKALYHILGSSVMNHIALESVADDAEISSVSRLLEEILHALITSSGDPTLAEWCSLVLNGICLHFAILHAQSSGRRSETGSPSSILVSCIAMNRALIRAASQVRSHVHNAAMLFLRTWMFSLQKVLGRGQMRLSDNAVVFHLAKQCTLFCHERSLSERIGGIRVLVVMCDSLPQGWCSEMQNVVVETFMVSLKNAHGELTCVALKDMYEALKRVTFSLVGTTEKVTTPLLELLLKSLVDESSLVRLAANSTIDTICSLRNVEAKELFHEFGHIISSLLGIQRPLDSFLEEECIGHIYGLTYCLNKDILQMPSTILQWSVISLLSSHLSTSLANKIKGDKMFRKRFQAEDPSGLNHRFPEDYIVHLSVFPNELPHGVSLRLALLHCLSAIFSNSRMMNVMKNTSDFITSAFSLILQSFHVQWADIISCSQTGLERAIDWLHSEGLNLPFQLLQDCLDIFLTTLSEPGRLSLAFLEGLKAFVKIPSLAAHIDFTEIYRLCMKELETLIALDTESYLQMYEAGSHRVLVAGLVDVLNELPSRVFPKEPVINKLCLLAHAYEVVHHRFPCENPSESPFAGIICHFSMKFPEETRHLFILNMHLPGYIHILEVLLHILALKSSESMALCRCLASAEGVVLLVSEMMQAFEVSTAGNNPEEQAPKRQKFDRLLNCEDWPASLHYQIMLTEKLVDYLPDVDGVKMQLLAIVRQLWRHAVMSKLTTASRNQFRIREDVACLCKILVSFFTMGLCQAEILLELVHVVSLEIGPNINFMYDLFQEDVPSLISPAVVQELIGMFLALAPDASMSMKWKSHCLRHLILPLVEAIFANKASLLKTAFADGRLVLGIASLWCTCSQPPVSPTCASPFAEDMQDDDSNLPVVTFSPPTISTMFLRNNPVATMKSMSAELWNTDMKIEYLKLTFVFLGQAHTMTSRTKLHFKKFVKYPWHILKAEELSSVRQWALMNLCRYASALGNSNAKFASSLYTHVLKTYQIEGKDMFSGTADEIVPLIARSPPDELIRLMRLTKKMLQDETLNALQHAHVLLIILKYPTVFYPFRILLSSQMLYSITRLGFNPNSSTEVRQMTLGIVEVFLIWENTRQEFVRQGKIDDDFYKIQKRLLLSQSSPDIYPEHNYGVATTVTSQNDYKLTPQMLSILVSFILRLGLSKETTQSQARSCVGFFRTYIEKFPMAGVKISNWEKMVHIILEGIKAHLNALQQDAANPALKQQPLKGGAGPQPKPQATMAMKHPLPEHLIITSLDMLTICFDSPEISGQIFTQHILLFTAYFQAVFVSENTLLHDSFSTFIVRVMQASLATPTPEFFESGFYRKLKSEMELQFRFNAQAVVASNISVLLSLRLIRDITKVFPSWIDNHGSSLVRLCQRLLLEMTQRNAKSARSDPSVGLSDDDNLHNVNNFHPTPSVSVMAEFLPSQLVSSNKPNLNTSADGCIELAYIFELLLGGIRCGYLEQFKQAIAHLVNTVIEGSLGQILSNIVAQFCLDEILVADSHLSKKEQNALLSKILQQHDKSLENVSHGYNIRMSFLSERLGPKFQQANPNSSLTSFTKINGLGHLGLMSPERAIREQCQNRMFASFGATPYERMLTFLAADIPCISHRHWLVLLTPIFLHGFSLQCDALCFTEIACNKGSFDDDEIDGDSCSARYSAFQSFLSGIASQTCEDLKSDVLELSLMHIESGERLWKELLQQIWAGLESYQREELTLSVMKSFLRNSQRKRSTWSVEIPGAGQLVSLLSAFSQLESPRPQFPTEFLACAVEHGGMNLGYDILADLHGDAASRPPASLNSTSPEIVSNLEKVRAAGVQEVTLQILSTLEDRDLTLATLRSGLIRPETDLCLSLEIYGFISKAQEMLVKLIAKENRMINDMEVVTEESDIEVLQSRWMECAKELGQWSSLCNYARNVGMIELAVESASRTCDLETLKDLRESHVLLSIGDGTLELDKFSLQEVQRSLTQWSNRSEVTRGSLFHKNLLHNFHRILELRESSVMLGPVSEDQPCDVPQMLDSWRSRLPPAVFSDTKVGVPGILGWDALLTWRGHIREALAPANMRSSTPSIVVEDAWEGLKWAKTAQQQPCPGSRQNPPPKPRDLFGLKPNETHEIFATIRVRVLRCLHDQQCQTTNGPQEGLQLLKGVNMTLFENDKIAEMLRLKALCEAHLSMVYEAHETFAQSVQTDESYSKSWLSWGQYCQQLVKHDGADMQARSKLGQYAVSCVLKAAQLDAASVRSHLAGVLRVTQSCDDEQLTVVTELVSSAEKALSWIWLGFIPSLLLMLQQKSGDLVKTLLIHIASRHPQPVLQHIMTLQSDMVKSGEATPQCAAILSRCAEIISKAGNPRSVTLLRRFNDELTADFSADKLFDMVQCIRLVVADVSEETLWGDSQNRLEISEKFTTTMLRITSDYFSDAFLGQNERTSWLKFKSDINTAIRSPSAQVLSTLVAWLGVCEEMQNRKNFARSGLRVSSFCPQNFWGVQYSRLELPGQRPHIRGDFSRNELVYIMRLVPSKDFGDCKQYCFLGSDGQTHEFAAAPDVKNIEQNAAFFKIAVDWSLQQSAECLRRDLSLESVEVTPLPGKIVLQKTKAVQKSLSDVVFDRLSGMSSSSVMLKYLELAGSQSPAVSLLDANISSYEQVCATLVPSTCLHESFVSSAHSSADLYNLRRSVASDLGVLAAFQYALCSKPPSARELFFSIADKSVAVRGVGPSFIEGGHVALGEGSIRRYPIPWRLTRSITASLSIPLLNGIMTPSLGCTLDAISQNAEVIQPFLELILMDHLEDDEVNKIGSADATAAKNETIHKMAAQMLADVKAICPSHTFRTSYPSPSSFEEKDLTMPPIDAEIKKLVHKSTLIGSIVSKGMQDPYL